MAQTESGNGHDNVDGLIEKAQAVLDDFERGRSQRARVSDEVLGMVAEVVEANDALGREIEGMRRNAVNLASRLDSAERREEDQRSRADAAEHDVADLRGALNGADERIRLQAQEQEVLREQHARLSQAFDDFLATLGDGARALQDEDKRFVAATTLARSRAMYGLPGERRDGAATQPVPGTFNGMLKQVSESTDAGDNARLTADEG